jgi:hypothetical protein
MHKKCSGGEHHKYNGELIGKKQDKAGRWRRAKVPDYPNEQRVRRGFTAVQSSSP